MAADQYKMSFTSGGLFLNESVEMARLQLDLQDWNVVVQNALHNRILMLPKEASNRRTAREITNRLRCLTELEIEFLVNSMDRNDGYHLLWVASCRAYKFIREFAVEVIVSRFQTYRVDLPLEAFDVFWEEKAEQHAELLETSKTTKSKLRQVLFRFLKEVGIIDEKNVIQNVYLSPQFISLIAANRHIDLIFFPRHN